MEKFQSTSKVVAADGCQEHQQQRHPHQEQQEQLEQEQYQRLRRAQRCLLQRNYKAVIAICSDYFQSLQERNSHSSCPIKNKTHSSTTGSQIVHLKCRIHHHPYADGDVAVGIHVECCEDAELAEPTTLDQMVVIALQAIEEKRVQLQMKASSSAASSLWNHHGKHHYSSSLHSKHLWKQMMECLSNSSIGLEAFCVWIQYWQTQGLWKETIEWNLHVLLMLGSLSSASERTKHAATICQPPTITSREELWIEFLAHQLPRIRDSKIAAELLGQLEEKVMRRGRQLQQPESGALNWDKMKDDIDACLLKVTMADQPQDQTIRLFHDSLKRSNYGAKENDVMAVSENNIMSDANGFLSPKAIKTIQTSWADSLEAMPQANKVGEGIGYNVEEKQEESMVSFQEHASSSSALHYSLRQQNPKQWTRMDRLVRFVHHKVHETIRQVTFARDNNPHFKSQVIVSLTMTILYWRQRKNLKQVLSYILLPIRELLDALKGL